MVSGLPAWPRTATVPKPGTLSCSNSSHFPAKAWSHAADRPVRLPPGRARLSTSPVATGSPIPMTTIGIARLALRAAIQPACPKVARTSTGRVTAPPSVWATAPRAPRPSAFLVQVLALRPAELEIDPERRDGAWSSGFGNRTHKDDPNCLARGRRVHQGASPRQRRAHRNRRRFTGSAHRLREYRRLRRGPRSHEPISTEVFLKRVPFRRPKSLRPLNHRILFGHDGVVKRPVQCDRVSLLRAACSRLQLPLSSFR